MKRILLIILCLLLLTGCVGAEDTQPVRIAVIDTGFSSVITNVAPGANYLDAAAGTEDTYGHGTAVASVMQRIAPGAVLVPLVCSAYEKGCITHVSGETLAQIIRDAVDIYGCRIINVSAGLEADTPQLAQAVAYAREKGALVVASAGNDFKENPEKPYYPAAYADVLAVGALNEALTAPAEFSQRGSHVSLYAPGTQVPVLTLSGKTAHEDGTSYAAAAVSAMAARLLARYPSASVAALEEKFLAKARVLPGQYPALLPEE